MATNLTTCLALGTIPLCDEDSKRLRGAISGHYTAASQSVFDPLSESFVTKFTLLFNLRLICAKVKMGVSCDLQTRRFRGHAAIELALLQGGFHVSGLAPISYVDHVSTRHVHRYRSGDPVRQRFTGSEQESVTHPD